MPVTETYHRDPNVWSASRMSLYQRCPRAWWLTYRADVDAVGRGPTPEHWRRGNAEHAALQAAYDAAQADVLSGSPRMGRYAGEAMVALVEAWQALELPRPSRLWDEAYDDTLAVLESLPVPRPDAIVSVEETAQLTIPTGVTVKAIIDLALSPAPGWLHIRDWKSFSKLPVDPTFQLKVYALVASLRWPEYDRITGSLYSIPRNVESDPVEFTADMHEGTINVITDIVAAADADETCRPLATEWCATCPVKRQCPLYFDDVTIGPDLDVTVLDEQRDALALAESW